MTRIVSGEARGRRLRVPGSGTRPTSDRVREALFASIEARLSRDLRDWSRIRFCDWFAGSGAVALEAWSRGCSHVIAIDSARSAVTVIDANVRALGASAQVKVLRADLNKAVTSAPPEEQPFDVLFADPPYEVTAASVRALLQRAQESGWVTSSSLVVVERPGRDPEPPLPVEFLSEDKIGRAHV